MQNSAAPQRPGQGSETGQNTGEDQPQNLEPPSPRDGLDSTGNQGVQAGANPAVSPRDGSASTPASSQQPLRAEPSGTTPNFDHDAPSPVSVPPSASTPASSKNSGAEKSHHPQGSESFPGADSVDNGAGSPENADGPSAKHPTSALYGAPFEARSFGAEYVWASSPQFVAKILRVRKDEKVRVTAQYRRDMSLMLSGGRACLEVQAPGQSLQTLELEPARPVPVDAQNEYRLIAMTDVELFTIYSPM